MHERLMIFGFFTIKVKNSITMLVLVGVVVKKLYNFGDKVNPDDN